MYVGRGRRERGVKGETIFLVGVESGQGLHLLRHGTLEGKTFFGEIQFGMSKVGDACVASKSSR